jgi:uncharacterized repeat protein (TIGR01451 family)
MLHLLRQKHALVSAAAIAGSAMDAYGADYTYSNTTVIEVGDNSCFGNFAVKQFVVTQSFIIADLDVGIVADLADRDENWFEVISPSNTTVVLAAFVGGSSDDINVRFNDEASQSITSSGDHNSGSSYPQYTLRPQNALSAFDGEAANGTWKVRICNNSGGANTDFEEAHLEFTAQRDYSDGPTAGYGGASHLIDSAVRLGAGVTPDAGDYNSTFANADSDDGVSLPSLVQGMPATITVSVAGSGGYLQGWIDWNGNGSFADPAEQVATNVQDGGLPDGDGTANGTILLSVTVPPDATIPTAYARFRWSSSASLGSSGSAPDGEVEDYALTIVEGAPSISVSKIADVTSNVPAGQVVQYSYEVSNTGNQTISNIRLSDVHGGYGTAPVPGSEVLTEDLGTIGDSTDVTPDDGIWSSLAPGDTVTFTAQYQVVQQDVDRLQ